MAAPSAAHFARHIPRSKKEIQREFEMQQPIIAELLLRLERLPNKRESFKVAAQRPNLPTMAMVKPVTKAAKSATLKMVEVPLASALTVKRKKTRPVLTMESALADTRLRQHFREFVEAAYAVENLDFFEAVERFEAATGDKERQQLSKTIVDEFVRSSASNQVNLPSSLATKLCTAVDTGAKEDVAKCLAQAQGEILSLLQTNFFDKFLSVVGQPAFVPADDSEDSDEEKKTTSSKGSDAGKPQAQEETEEKKKFFKNWVQRRHPKTGDTYYENPDTGVTMWDVPKPISLPPPIEPPPYF